VGGARIEGGASDGVGGAWDGVGGAWGGVGTLAVVETRYLT
jgi:hypothetical protein